MKKNIVILILLLFLSYQAGMIGRLLTISAKLHQQVAISSDAMMECRIGTASALVKSTYKEKMQEILATYTFVVDKETQFMKLFPIDKQMGL